VAYAQARHITIVPEIEMPGHSTAGVAAYPQYSCNPTYAYDLDNINYTYDVYSPGTTGTFQFLEDILTEVIGLFPGKYIHTGGDEVVSSIWTTYPADKAKMQQLGLTTVQQYQSWFSTQIANWLQAQGRTMIGWTEIEYGGILTNAVCMDWLTSSSSEAVTTASAWQYVVRTPNTNCYFNYYMSQNHAVEPYANSYLPVSAVYNFEPVPAGLAAAYTNYILGAGANLWAENVPSYLNVEFKFFPRLCAMAETTWTPAAMKNYANFTQRLTTHQQRLAQMGVNYDRTNAVQIGSWAAPVSTSGVTVNYNITPYLSVAGEIDVSFYYTSGADGLDVQWTALLENGVELDRDSFAGFAGSTYTALPVYVLHVPALKPGATYTIRSSIAGHGGTATAGTVYLTNWN
jgi:hexosaminidase